jgi:transposase
MAPSKFRTLADFHTLGRKTFDAIVYVVKTGCQWRQFEGLATLGGRKWILPALTAQ